MTIPYDAVIFDLDGTLVDSEAIIVKAAEVAFAVHGMEMDHGLIHGMVGVDAVTCRRRLVDHFGAMTADAFTAVWDREIVKGYARDMPLKPHVPEVLSDLYDLGVPIALCTSSGRANAEHKLDRASIAQYFSALVTLDDVIHPKPAAEPYLNAAKALQADPARCLAFEDSETGARAAKDAGMTVVQIPDVVPTQGEHAHHVAETLGEGTVLAGLMLRSLHKN